MSNLLKRSYTLLSSREKRLFGLVFFAMAVTAAFEVVGVGSILPFLDLVTDPSAVESSRWLAWGFNAFGFSSENSYLMAVGGAVLAIIVLTQVVSAATVWLQIHVARRFGHNIQMRLMRHYLDQPYSFFLSRSTSDLSTNVLGEANKLVTGIYMPLFQIVSQALIAGAILTLLLILEPTVTFVALGLIGGIYAAIYIGIRRKLKRLGRDRYHANQGRYKTAGEAFGGLKTTKVLGIEEKLADHYQKHSFDHTESTIKRGVLSKLPGYAIRALTFGGLMAILLLFMSTGRPVEEFIPVMGLFAFAGYRMMPAFTSILTAMANMRYNQDVLEAIFDDLTDAPTLDEFEARDPPDPLPFEETIELAGVNFTYATGSERVLNDISLEIEKDQTVAFVGLTGAGKTTLLDVLLGLLSPEKGELLIDGQPITDQNVRGWRANIGYIPQELFLSNDTIRRNIAFGVPEDEIDQGRVEEVAEIAHIHDFIERDLEDGYDTLVGERGTRLSGGQRQRIGIARALYRDPAVLVFDEATSDIDNITEAHIVRALDELSGEKTMIVVAHRLQTVQKCDRIFLLDQGRIVAEGTFEALREGHSKFRELAQDVAPTTG